VTVETMYIRFRVFESVPAKTAMKITIRINEHIPPVAV